MFVDTSGFLCRDLQTEACHEKAIEFYNSAKTRLTTNYVLAEYVALASVRGLRGEDVVNFSEKVLGDKTIEIFWVDEKLHTEAVRLLKKRSDKKYSLCDAVSFVLMRERKIAESLTTDKHFEQEGFVRLLK